MQPVADGVYKYVGRKKSVAYYERVRVDGKDTFKKLPAATLAEAKTARAARLTQHAKAKEGLFSVVSPYEKKAPAIKSASFDQLCQFFLDSNCPDKDRCYKKGRQLEDEKRRVKVLRRWSGWDKQPLTTLDNATLLSYEAWRREEKKSKVRNGRSIDMEVTTLKNVLRWAVLNKRLASYPFANVERMRFQRGASVSAKHCCAQSPDELHEFAAELFSYPQSEVLGFQFLIEAFTGIRTSEALALRKTEKHGAAGYRDAEFLHLARCKDGINPWAKIHPALAELLAAHDAWLKWRYPKSPFYFPSPWYPDTQAVGPQSLAHSLRRIVEKRVKDGKLPEGSRRTSHGARAFYVWVRRSELVTDGEIAAEIGDATGAPIIVKHYGPLPPNWRDSKEGKVAWVPAKGQPAWRVILNKIKAAPDKYGPPNVIVLPDAVAA
jgi:integrase